MIVFPSLGTTDGAQKEPVAQKLAQKHEQMDTADEAKGAFVMPKKNTL